MSTHEIVAYAVEPGLTVDEFADVLRRSTLAERRPLDEPGALAGMLKHANVILTARVDGKLVGISRAITDFHFCTYLSDLAVDEAFQKQGIGKELIRRTHEAAGLNTTLILLAAPKARGYYPHIGMAGHDSCWIIPPRAKTLIECHADAQRWACSRAPRSQLCSYYNTLSPIQVWSPQ